MGEIAEALRRAHADRASRGERPTEAPGEPREAIEGVYSESARRHAEEQSKSAGPPRERSREPSPPAPAASHGRDQAVEESAAALRATAQAGEETAGIRITRDAPEARILQGVLIDEGGAVTDACLQLALRVRKELERRSARTILVASAMRDEGKTTVSCNLALALASLGQVERVALVDLDLRRPSLARALELPPPGCGIEDVIAGGQPLAQACVHVSQPTIDIYPCLRGQAKAHEILLLPGFQRTLETLRDQYEIVVLDSPPTLVVPDATIIMQHADCFAPVARAGISRSRSFRKMLEILPRRSLLGAILDCGVLGLRNQYYDQYTVDDEDVDG